MVAVHEFVHSVSAQERHGKVGIHDEFTDPTFQELNEAIADIATYLIAGQHLARNKTPLRRLSTQVPNVHESGYTEYIALTQAKFAKIPLRQFVDAMLTEGGFERLVESFSVAYGDLHALTDFGKTLRDLFLTPEERKRRSSLDDRKKKMGKKAPPTDGTEDIDDL